MKPNRFVVLAERARGFTTLEEALQFARANVPAVVCERRTNEQGELVLVEIVRHDHLFDAERGEWRIMMG